MLRQNSDFLGDNTALICFFLFCVAFGVRLLGADYGYFHGDERINDAARVLAGQLIPGQHFYPPFINYLNAVGFAGLFGIGLGVGWWDSPGAFRGQYFMDPTLFYLTARGITAATGALLAPLFYVIARRFGVTRLPAIVVGMSAIVFPLSVFMAHIAKGDTGLAVAYIACIWALVGRLQSKGATRWDWIMAVCVALTVSFKQSGIFLLLPLAVLYTVQIGRLENWGKAAASFMRVTITSLIVWAPLNIGLLMDLQNFIAFQNVQTAMSLDTGAQGPMDGIIRLLQRSVEFHFGLTPLASVVALTSPLLLLLPQCHLRGKMLLFWIGACLTISTLAVAVLTGPRQPEHLWIANFAGFLLIGMITLAGFARSANVWTKYAAATITGLMIASMSFGTIEILHQAKVPSLTRAVTDHLTAQHPERRFVSAFPVDREQDVPSLQWEQDRIIQLSDRYDLEPPLLAPERFHNAQNAETLSYLKMPIVMYGLEDVNAGDESYEVVAHTWPLQPEEWEWGFWQDQGVELIVVTEFDTYAHIAPPKIRQNFFQWIDANCVLDASFDPRKPLFLEREVRVYDCAGVTPPQS